MFNYFLVANKYLLVSVHCCCSVTQLCPTFCDPMDCSTSDSLSFTISAQTHTHWVDDAIQPSHPLPSSPPALNLSQHQIFSSELALCIRWPKYWSFSFLIPPSSEDSWLISFKIVWFDLFAVQGTLKSLLQHHSSKASVLWCSAFIMVQLWHPYMTTGETIAWTRWTFVGKVMSLLYNTLSRFVIAFLLRSKSLLISWLQSLYTVILESKKIKSLTVSIDYPSICH